MSHFVITGAKGGATQGATAPNRLEINVFIKNREQFSLYIQALRVMHTTSQTNPLSHFGIGGIHGLPYVQWEGAGGTSPVQGTGFGGYCTHGSVLFPTWHRPYLALFEQVLQQHALDIAKTYCTNQQRWLTAAQNLRAPYWDWATNSVPPPEVISLETVYIITPDGKTTAVPNPIIKYTFCPIDPSFPSRPTPYKYWKTTIRHPDDPTSPNATTDVQALINVLSSIQDDITDSTYKLLTRVHTWPAFSNHTPGDGGSSSNSLEAIHDKMHGYVGGHMNDVSVAGFDPIFFLHHCNVDRLLSLWSAVNPGVWVTCGPAVVGSFTISGNSTVDDRTSLTPFWNSQTCFWDSSEVATTAGLHYTYPEFNRLNLDNPGAVQVAIANYINKQYGWGHFSLLKGPAGGYRQIAEHGGHGQETPNVVHDWAVRIHAKKYELGHGYVVLIFLGDVPDDPSHWRTCSTFVGAHVAFVNAGADQCANCREQAELVIEGFVHLSAAIVKRSGLASYEPSVVCPYLRDNLHWRIQTADRAAIEIERLPSLEVTTVSNILTDEPGSVFPVCGGPEYHHHVTHGRLGGARQAYA